MPYAVLVCAVILAVVFLVRLNRKLEAATQIAMLLNRGYSVPQTCEALKITPDVVAYYQSRSQLFKDMVQHRARARSLPR